MLAVILISGGLDSAACAKIAIERKFNIATLFIDYGQRTWHEEREAAHKISMYLKAEAHLELNLTPLGTIGGSTLTNAGAKTEATTYVPFRNAQLVSIATAWAEVIDASHIFVGSKASDAHPDTTREFYTALEKVIEIGTSKEPGIKIVTPLIEMSPEEALNEIIDDGELVRLTYSCFYGKVVPCGKCAACEVRLKAFRKLRFRDPLLYPEGIENTGKEVR